MRLRWIWDDICFVDDMLLRCCCWYNSYIAASATIDRSIEDDDRYAVDAIICCESAMCISYVWVSKVIELLIMRYEVNLTIYAIVDNSESNVDAKSNREIILRQQVFEPLWALWNHASLNRVIVSQMQISLENIYEKFVTHYFIATFISFWFWCVSTSSWR